MNSTSPSTGFKDRSTGLTIFGILTVLGGIISGFFALLTFVVRSMPTGTPGSPLNRSLLAPVIIKQVLLAVALIWLGIGSIKARRWARAILLIFSWTSLAIGVVALGFMALMASHFLEVMRSVRPAGQPELSESVQLGALVFMGAFLSFRFVAIPLVWGLFYSSKHVKATCEARDPVIRWTDRCPLPVLALSLWLVFGAATLLVMPISYHGLFPFFGMLLSGAVIYIVLALTWVYCAYAIYKLDPNGWWIILVGLCAVSVSSAITYPRYDMNEVYQQMGFSAEQIALVRKFGFYGKNLMWTSLISTVPLLGYLFYVRKYFSRPAGEPTQTPLS